LVDGTVKTFGQLDVAVNNARFTGRPGQLATQTLEAYGAVAGAAVGGDADRGAGAIVAVFFDTGKAGHCRGRGGLSRRSGRGGSPGGPREALLLPLHEARSR